MVFTLIAQLLLWIWFLGCTITWRFGKLLLVEGMGIKSAEFVMLCLYSIGLITYYLFQPAGRWILFAILVIWLVIQFFCHWYYTIFGASESKLKGYNECFKDTARETHSFSAVKSIRSAIFQAGISRFPKNVRNAVSHSTTARAERL